MNFSEVFKTLNQASAFDLFRLRAAIDRALDEPSWLRAVHRCAADLHNKMSQKPPSNRPMLLSN